MTNGNGKMVMNNEFGENWEEVVVHYVKLRPLYFPGVIKETEKTPVMIRFQVRDSNRVFPNVKEKKVTTTVLRSLVFKHVALMTSIYR
jgi:hypothetical protein